MDVTKGNDGAFTEAPADPAAAPASAGAGEGDAPSGPVPGFWLQAMMNHGMLVSTVAEEDVAALEHLVDIRCVDKEDLTVRIPRGGADTIRLCFNCGCEGVLWARPASFRACMCVHHWLIGCGWRNGKGVSKLTL